MGSQKKYKTGILFYDVSMNQMDIQFDDETMYGGLHHGECLEVKVSDCWIPVRIELNTDWCILDENDNEIDMGIHWLDARKEMEV